MNPNEPIWRTDHGIRYASRPNEAKAFDTPHLREEFLIERACGDCATSCFATSRRSFSQAGRSTAASARTTIRSFVVAGDNQMFEDMDAVAMKELQ